MVRQYRKNAETKPVLVRLPAETLSQIDETRRQVDDLPTRPEMIRRMIEDWLDRNRQS